MPCPIDTHSCVVINQAREEVAALSGQLVKSEKARRSLHNKILHIRGNIRVFVRVRSPEKKPCLPVCPLAGEIVLLLCIFYPPKDDLFWGGNISTGKQKWRVERMCTSTSTLLPLSSVSH